MRLIDVRGVAQMVSDTPVADDRLWNKELCMVSETDIQLFYARSQLAGARDAAIDVIDRLQAMLIAESFEGRESSPAIILHVPPVDRFMVDELVDGLAKLPLPRRRAILYALETGSSPKQITVLPWKGLPAPNSRIAAEILTAAGQTRHMKLPYVFWEWVSAQIAAPLLELQWSAEQAFGCPWPQIVSRYSLMGNIDRRSEDASFLKLADEIIAGRL